MRGLAHNPWATAATLPLVSGVTRDLVHAWRNGDTVEWKHFDPVEEEMVEEEPFFFGADHRAYPVGLAVRSDDANPAFTYFDEGEDAMVYGRWDVDEVVDVTVLPPCADAYAPLELRDEDLFSTVCQTPLFNGNRDIFYVFDDGSDPDPVEFRVFGNDGDHWQLPDLALVGDDAVVAAFNDDDNELVIRWQVDGAWQNPVAVLQYQQVIALAVDARETGEGLVISVIARTGDAVFYLERTGAGVSQRRADLYPEDASACAVLLNNVDIHLQNDDDAWLNWQVEYVASAATWPGPGLVSDRFTAFRRADLGNHEEAGLTRPHNGTALVLEDEGDGWTCFYTEDENDDISLYAQRRDAEPILIEANTGAPSLIYPRSCEIGVDEYDNVHVVFGNTETNHLRYRMRIDNVWEAAFDLEDSQGDVPATPHVALAVAWDGSSSIVYQRPVSGNMRACVLDTFDQETWTTTCFSHNGGGMYPDITTVDVGGYPHALVFGVNANQIRAALTSTLPGGWTDELIINNEASFDYSIASRKVGGDGTVVAAWSTGGSIRWGSRNANGSWSISTLESAAGEYPSVALNRWLKPVFTWTRIIAGQDRLRIAAWEPHAKKRDLGDALAVPPIPSEPPEGRFTICDLKNSDYGTAVELDGHGNPRITYRRTNAVAFTTRP